MERSVTYAAQRGLQRKRHQDLALPFHVTEPSLLQPDIGVVDAKLPTSVQVLPLRADKLRARIFRPWDVCGTVGIEGGYGGNTHEWSRLMKVRLQNITPARQAPCG